MTVRFSDPHRAISWDGMHAHDHGLGGSTSGRPSKATSKNMGELDQQKLMLSMQHFFWSEYHSLLIFLFSIEPVVSQLGEGFIVLIK